jgi:hypothetical protein
MWLRLGSGLLMTGMLWGCTTVNGTPPPGSAPLFHADAADRVILQTVQREQDALLSTCAQHESCDQVHFTQAMIALFQNGDVAVTSFQKAIAVAPKSPLADSSARWIRFLAGRTFQSASAGEPNEVFNGALAVMKGLVRTWIEQQRATNASVPLRAVETATNTERTVHTLQQRIRDRDKRIAELTDQLSALKQIDLETHRPNQLSLPNAVSK